MIQVGEFEKVSFEEFYRATREWPAWDENETREIYNAIQLPTRATSGSAGNDFKAPFTFHLGPSVGVKIPTGIRVKIDDGWFLGCLPRSSLGFKCRMQLDNTIGVIDSDYYYSDNEGHIFVKITNDTYEGKILSVNAGEGFVQGIFLPYGVTYSDNAKAVRNGGMGSTNK